MSACLAPQLRRKGARRSRQMGLRIVGLKIDQTFEMTGAEDGCLALEKRIIGSGEIGMALFRPSRLDHAEPLLGLAFIAQQAGVMRCRRDKAFVQSVSLRGIAEAVPGHLLRPGSLTMRDLQNLFVATSRLGGDRTSFDRLTQCVHGAAPIAQTGFKRELVLKRPG